jgi:hypothetical protein
VLTARHCVSILAEGLSVSCVPGSEIDTKSPVVGAWPLESLAVFLDAPQGPRRVEVAQVFTPQQPSICGMDVALLRLATPEEGAGLTPLRRKVPVKGERAMLVGWGVSGEESEERRKHALEVGIREIGPRTDDLPTGQATFVLTHELSTDSGACYGDSGAPLLDPTTGAGLAVFSRYEVSLKTATQSSAEDCANGRPIFTRVDAAPIRAFIEEALATRGLVPWDEGMPRPAGFDQRCGVQQPCWSGLCLDLSEGGRCTRRCSVDDPCPASHVCAQVQGEDLCMPTAPPAEPPGCVVAPVPRGGSLAALALPGLLLALRRRRPWRCLRNRGGS